MAGPHDDIDAIVEVWDDVLADMAATAAEYRGRGWDVVELHPGDVTALDGTGPDGRWGLDLLVPDDEFDSLRCQVDEADDSFDACEVFRAGTGDMVYLVVAMLDRTGERAVVFPAYYDPGRPAVRTMFERAREAGQMRTHLRPLAETAVVTFAEGDPDLFAPDE